MANPRRSALALAVLSLAAGCGGGPAGPTLHPASGRVRVGGKPAVGVRVRLHPRGMVADAPAPHAVTGPGGSFALETAGRPGAPEGHYAVTITWPSAGFGPPGRAAADRFAGRHASADRPVGEATIRPGTNDLAPLDVPEVARSSPSPSASPSAAKGPRP